MTDWNKKNPRFKRPSNFQPRQKESSKIIRFFKKLINKSKKNTKQTEFEFAKTKKILNPKNQKIKFFFKRIKGKFTNHNFDFNNFLATTKMVATLIKKPLLIFTLIIIVPLIAWKGFHLIKKTPKTDTPITTEIEIVKTITDTDLKTKPLSSWENLDNLAQGTVNLGPYENSSAYFNSLEIKSLEIESGKTLSETCENLDLSRNEQVNILEALKSAQINQVIPGDRLSIFKDGKSIPRVEFKANKKDNPMVFLEDFKGSFKYINMKTEPNNILMATQGKINDTLWDSAIQAGLPAELVPKIANLFAYEIDFFADIKIGDSFQILYSRNYQDGEPLGAPVIELAKLNTKEKNLAFYHHKNIDNSMDYYDLKGNSYRKLFLASPLQYSKISSKFSLNRKHPILKTVRPHQGIDYAAPSGTEISSVANGKIIFAEWKGGYGKLVTIQHDNNYITMYAHLEGFAPNIKKGTSVKQGDVIGYVGSTGLSTGPHLDFRMKKNNTFVDPLKELTKQQTATIDFKNEFSYFALSAEQKSARMNELFNN